MVPDCPPTPPVRTVLAGQGLLESVVAGPDRRLYFTDGDKQALVRLNHPDAEPVTVAGDVDAPGGLLPGLDGRSVVLGYGNSLPGGATGNLFPRAGLLRVDLETGEKTTIATGTGMSNGLARDADGAIYASNDLGDGIDRVVGSAVQPNWATVPSANGLAVDGAGRFLYANQTFQPAAIVRIDLADPTDVTTYARPPAEDFAAGLDGLAIDQFDNLFAAVNLFGEVWRVDADDQSICALARGLKNPSAVAFGAGGPFPHTSLYAVGFGGEVTEIPGARNHLPLRVRLRPRKVRARRTTQITVRVTSGGDPLQGVPIRIGRRRLGTDHRGIARFTVRPRRAGRRSIHVGDQTVTLRVRRAGRAPRRPGRTG